MCAFTIPHEIRDSEDYCCPCDIFKLRYKRSTLCLAVRYRMDTCVTLLQVYYFARPRDLEDYHGSFKIRNIHAISAIL